MPARATRRATGAMGAAEWNPAPQDARSRASGLTRSERTILRAAAVAIVAVSLLGLDGIRATYTQPTSHGLAAHGSSLTAEPPVSATHAGGDEPTHRLELLYQVGGASHAVDVDARYAYAGVGPRLVVLDVSRAGELRYMGRTEPLPGIVRAVEFRRDHVFIAFASGDLHVHRGGLAVVNVADPAHPQMVGVLTLDAALTGLTRIGDHIVASGNRAPHEMTGRLQGVLKVIDVSNVAAPRTVATMEFDRAVPAVTHVGSVAYGIEASPDDRIAVRSVDVSIPEAPTLIGTTAISGTPRGIATDGTYVYVAAGSSGLIVLERRDGGVLCQVGRLTAPSRACTDAVVVFRDRAAITDPCAGAARLIDISEPRHPFELASLAADVGAGVALHGDRALVAAGGAGGIQEIDISDDALTMRARWTPGSPAIRSLSVGDGAVYAAHEDVGFVAIDRAQTEGASEYARLPLEGAADIVITGTTVYVSAPSTGLLHVLDLADPAEPRPLTQVPMEGRPGQMVVDGLGHLYVASTQGGLRVLDLTDPERPREIGAWTEDSIDSVAYAKPGLVASESIWLFTIDVSDPAHPRPAGRLGIGPPGFSDLVALATHEKLALALLSYVEPDIAVVDISDLALPKTVGWIGGEKLGSYPHHLALSGTNLHVGSSSGVVTVALDQDAGYPVLARWDSPGSVSESAALVGEAQEDLVYAADGDGGLACLRLEAGSEVRTPTPTPSPQPTRTPTAVPTASPTPRGGSIAYLPHAFGRPRAAPPDDEALVAHVGGPSWSLEAVGDLLYRAEGPTLAVIDASNVSNPKVIGRTDPLPGLVHDVRVAGERAFLAAGDAGLAVVDVADPTDPRIIGSLRLADQARGVDLNGDVAYVAAASAGLRVIDVSNPMRLREVGSLSSPDIANHIKYHREHVYLVANFSHAARIVSVSDPASPVEVAKLPHSCMGEGGPDYLDVHGDYAYSADDSGTLDIIDISVPSSPKLVNDIYPQEGEVQNFRAVGNRGYAAFWGFSVWDLSDPVHPRLSGESDRLPLAAKDISVADSIAFVTGDSRGPTYGWEGEAVLRAVSPVAILDVRSASEPRQIGSYSGPLGPTGQGRQFALGDLIVRHTGWRLDEPHLVDVSSPRRPVHLGPIETFAGIAGLVVQGNLGYACRGEDPPALEVFDVTNPDDPRVLGSAGLQGTCRSLAAAENLAYVLESPFGEYSSTLEIADVSDPDAPATLGAIQLDAAAYDVAAASGFALVAGAESGATSGAAGCGSTRTTSNGPTGAIWVIDTDEPASPELVGTLPLEEAGRTYQVEVAASYAYVMADCSLRVLDLAALPNLTEVARVTQLGFGFDPHWFRRLALGRDRAYVTSDRLSVVDLADPTDPKLSHEIYPPSYVPPHYVNLYDPVAIGDHVYVPYWSETQHDQGMMVIGRP